MTRKTETITVIAYDFRGREFAFTRVALIYSSRIFRETKQNRRILLY